MSKKQRFKLFLFTSILIINNVVLLNLSNTWAEDVILTVLCHGIRGKSGNMDEIEDAIKEKSCILNIDYPSTEGTIQDFSYMLDFAIRQTIKRFKNRDVNVKGIVLVGHSMGGLAERYYIESRKARFEDIAAQVKAVVMLGTPNHGSFFADVACISAVLAGEKSELIPPSIIKFAHELKKSTNESKKSKALPIINVYLQGENLLQTLLWGKLSIFQLNTISDGFIKNDLNKYGFRENVYYCVIAGTDSSLPLPISMLSHLWDEFGSNDGVVLVKSTDISDLVTTKENYRFETVNATHFNITENGDAKRIVKEVVEKVNIETGRLGFEEKIQEVCTENFDEKNRRRKLSVGLILDSSGSMEREDRLKEAKRASVSLINLIGFNDKVALITFGSNAKVNVSFNDKFSRSDIIKNIGDISLSGNTNFEDGLLKGYEELATLNSEEKRVALFISDGGKDSNVIGDHRPILEKYREFQIPIFTVGVGSDVGEEILREMADTTGGQFFWVSSTSLQQAFAQISNCVQGYSNSMVVKGVIQQGQIQQNSLEVREMVAQVRFFMNWVGSKVGMYLISPSGKKIRPENSISMDGVTYKEDVENHTVFYIVENPEIGLWRIFVVGEDVPSGGEIYTLTASIDSPIVINLIPTTSFISPGETTKIGFLTNKDFDGNITSATAIVSSPTGRVLKIKLNDKGLYGDIKAGDNMFSSDIQVGGNGLYSANINISGEDMLDKTFSRVLKTYFQVGTDEDIMKKLPADNNTVIYLGATLSLVIFITVISLFLYFFVWRPKQQLSKMDRRRELKWS